MDVISTTSGKHEISYETCNIQVGCINTVAKIIFYIAFVILLDDYNYGKEVSLPILAFAKLTRFVPVIATK